MRSGGVAPSPSSDEQLVRDCLRQDERAWAALVEKYKNLVYSIPLKYGLPREDANDIFQAVWLDLLRELPRLRQPKALPAWLIRATARKCFHWRRRDRRHAAPDERRLSRAAVPVGTHPDHLLRAARDEQMLRAALATLSPRCQAMVRMLFFESPARPYAEVARQLGLATGSIGFLRRDCLRRLRQKLAALGFD